MRSAALPSETTPTSLDVPMYERWHDDGGGRFSIRRFPPKWKSQGKIAFSTVNRSTKELNYNLQLKDVKYDLRFRSLASILTSINSHFYES